MIPVPAHAPRHEGTRFRLFPQAPYGTATPRLPEVVWLSPPAGTIGPGPCDDRMYVVDPVDKPQPYGIARGPYGTPFLYLPPWTGAIYPPAMPDEEGHFDHLEDGTPEFEAAHAYGVVRFVLDVWDRYFGRPIEWHFLHDQERLEVSLFRDLENALAGYGFLEVGAHTANDADYRPYSLNFDVLAHEVGHLIIYSEVGVPEPEAAEGEYFGFHESAADLVALISALHFDSVVDDLLQSSRGNLYTLNKLARIGEVAENEEIRIASNSRVLSEFAIGWVDEHLLSEPLTGAIFDIFVDVFHEGLLDRGLISPEVEDLADQVEQVPEYEPLIQALFDRAFARDPAGFKDALLDARDYLGVALAVTWSRLSPDYLAYEHVGEGLLAVDRELNAGRYHRLIVTNFRLRDIGAVAVGPRLAAPGPESHTYSDRSATPTRGPFSRRVAYRERWLIAHPP
jgi:hypothetical protein